jgi:hypothetical protein
MGSGRRLTQRERDTLGELHHLDPQLASLYEQGVQLLGRLDEPAAAGVLAYVGRELSRATLERVLDEERTELLDQEDAGDDAIFREELRKALQLSPEHPTLEFVCRLAREAQQHALRRILDELGVDITEELESVLKKGRNRSRIAHALKLQPDDPKVDAWFRLPSDFAKWEKYRADGPPPEDVRRAFETLSDLLFGLLAPYYVTERDLDELLALDVPEEDDARRLHGIQLRAVQRSYFFSRLENPKWIAPLTQAGFFKSPPDRQVNPDGSWRTRAWPEGEYLVRVAPEAPVAVAGVLKSLPEANENPVVWEAVANAACQLPPNVAAELVPKLSKALCTPGARVFSESVVELVVHLADTGQAGAFDLTEHLLFVEAAGAIQDRDHVAYRSNTEWVFPRFGWHGQRELLDKLVPTLESLDAKRTLRLLLSKIRRVQALADSIERSGRWLVWGLDFEARSDPEDVVSGIARAAVDLAERMANQDQERAEQVMAVLDGYQGGVFTRLSYRVLAAAGEHLRDRLDAFVCSDEAVHAGHPAREVALVLRKQFKNASAAARRAFANAVMRGPDRGELRQLLEGGNGQEPTDQEIDHHVGQWQRRRLRWFRGDIPEELTDVAEAHDLLGRKPSYEEQQLAEVGFHVGAGSWGGVEPTPITPEQLSALSPEEAVVFLAEWKPGSGDGTAAGLHTTLSQFGKEHPKGALAILKIDDNLAPAWIESLLRGILEAARGNAELDWIRVLEAVHGVAYHAAAVKDMELPDALAWRRALSPGLEIIREGCGHDSIPPECDSHVWAILQEAGGVRLLWELAGRETPESFEDVLMASLNDAAGILASAVISAGLWHYRAGLPKQGADVSEEMRDQARAPVREILTPLLDGILAERGPNDASAQAVLGQFIPQLHLLAREWVHDNDELLFAKGLDEPVAHPAWTAYIDMASLYDSVFEALRPWYLKAVERIAEWEKAAGDARSRGSVVEKLSGHLMVAVLRGLVTPTDEDGLLVAAFENVDASDWGHAYWGVFRSWSDAEAPPPAAFVERLVEFWEWRLSQLEAVPDSEVTREEAKALGWLFHTPHIPDSEVIRLGKTTARLAEGELKMYSRWERMLELAKADPADAFEIGEAVILAELRSEYPHIPQDARPFLEHVLKVGGEGTRHRARRLVHKLGEKGFRQFRDLLDESEAA